jgi:response regulator of citrate/malate metabolism
MKSFVTLKLEIIQEKHKKHKAISYGSSIMEKLKEGGVVDYLARPFCIAKFIRRLQIIRA